MEINGFSSKKCRDVDLKESKHFAVMTSPIAVRNAHRQAGCVNACYKALNCTAEYFRTEKQEIREKRSRNCQNIVIHRT